MQVKDVLLDSAILLNDSSRVLYDDVTLLPYFKIAFNELMEMLEDNNVPVTNQVSASIPIAQGVTDIGNLGPALPVGLVEIQSVWERLLGSSEDYILVNKLNYLPLTSIVTQDLQCWAWINQVITFLGALTARDVKINYISNNLSANIVDGNSSVPIINSRTNLAYRTAALCSSFVGENKDRADELNSFASGALERLINLSIKGQQATTTRRRPFRAGYKMRSSM